MGPCIVQASTERRLVAELDVENQMKNATDWWQDVDTVPDPVAARPNITHDTWVIVRVCSSSALASRTLTLFLSFAPGRDTISSRRAPAFRTAELRWAGNGSFESPERRDDEVAARRAPPVQRGIQVGVDSRLFAMGRPEVRKVTLLPIYRRRPFTEEKPRPQITKSI